MIQKSSKSFSAGAGEHLVLGELLKRGTEAYLAHGKTQPGWDIAAINIHGKILRIQVKAINWPLDCAVNGKFHAHFDILIIVLLNGNDQTRFLVIPQSNLDQYLSAPNPDKRGLTRTLTIGKNFKNHTSKSLINYENDWSAINNLPSA